MKILLVEDDDALREVTHYGLEREGFRVTEASTGTQALARFRSDTPDLVILDLMLPEVSGLDVCKTIRASSAVPIIIVTAKEAEADKVAGLELGADDYVTKPFSMRELVARVRAVLRRGVPVLSSQAVLRVGPIVMDVEAHEVRIGGRLVDLPPKEFDLLLALLERAGRLSTRQALIDQVWGPEYFGDTRTLDVHIKRLRRKIEPDPNDPTFLKTVRGLGYKLDAAE
jgi:two-component system response regulator RegX3